MNVRTTEVSSVRTSALQTMRMPRFGNPYAPRTTVLGVLLHTPVIFFARTALMVFTVDWDATVLPRACLHPCQKSLSASKIASRTPGNFGFVMKIMHVMAAMRMRCVHTSVPTAPMHHLVGKTATALIMVFVLTTARGLTSPQKKSAGPRTALHVTKRNPVKNFAPSALTAMVGWIVTALVLEMSLRLHHQRSLYATRIVSDLLVNFGFVNKTTDAVVAIQMRCALIYVPTVPVHPMVAWTATVLIMELVPIIAPIWTRTTKFVHHRIVWLVTRRTRVRCFVPSVLMGAMVALVVTVREMIPRQNPHLWLPPGLPHQLRPQSPPRSLPKHLLWILPPNLLCLLPWHLP